MPSQPDAGETSESIYCGECGMSHTEPECQHQPDLCFDCGGPLGLAETCDTCRTAAALAEQGGQRRELGRECMDPNLGREIAERQS